MMENDNSQNQTQNGHIILYLIIILVFNFFLVLYFKAKTKSREFLNSIVKKLGSKEVLIIIAHPDDETIFFFPTIQALVSKSIKVNVLCLSNGDYYKQGEIRLKEMHMLQKHLNLNSVEVINKEELKDDITKYWDTDVVAQEIKSYLAKNDNIGIIFTFDDQGVTCHPNHISCKNGLL